MLSSSSPERSHVRHLLAVHRPPWSITRGHCQRGTRGRRAPVGWLYRSLVLDRTVGQRHPVGLAEATGPAVVVGGVAAVAAVAPPDECHPARDVGRGSGGVRHVRGT